MNAPKPKPIPITPHKSEAVNGFGYDHATRTLATMAAVSLATAVGPRLPSRTETSEIPRFLSRTHPLKENHMAKKKAAPKTIDAEHVKTLRKASGLNQGEFWAKVGVTQSGGSRYEGGRSIPKPVQMLIPIVHHDAPQARAQVEKLRGAPL